MQTTTNPLNVPKGIQLYLSYTTSWAFSSSLSSC